MNISFSESLSMMSERGYLRVFDTNVMNGSFFVKQILAGAFITIAMTGIDQDMMQKNISVSNLKDSQKNMLVLTLILLGMITLFLYMGGMLHLFAEQKNITAVSYGSFGIYVSADRGNFHHWAYFSLLFQC